MARLFYVSALILSLICISNALFTDTVLTATLTGQQVVPTAGNPYGFGNAACQYFRNLSPPQLACTVTHNVVDPVAAYIFIGSPATNTAYPTFTFTTTLGPTFTQTFSFSDSSYESNLLNGLFYITISTVVYPGGEIRGQLLNNDRAYSVLGPEQTVPRASGTNSRGLAVATYSFFNPRRLLSIDLQHNVLNPTAVEVRIGGAGHVGPLITRLHSALPPVIDSFQFTVGEEVEFLDDNTYIQVLSTANPNGEIRGQINTIDIEPEAGFTTRLNGANENPPTLSSAVGCGIFLYDCNTRLFQYLIFHNVINATSAIIEQAVNGSTGTAVFGLSRAQSPIFGANYLTLEEEYLLYSLQLYVNIISSNSPQGEIRGQINVQYQYYAYLSGAQVNPPVTTSAIGCATFYFTSNRTMNYDIEHSVQVPISTDFDIGAIGQNGRFAFSFPNTISPIQGNVDLDDDQLANLVDGLSYVNIRSSSYFDGEIRGQILRVNPCTVTRDNGISAPAPPQPFITNLNFNINTSNSVSISLLVVMFVFALALFMW